MRDYLYNLATDKPPHQKFWCGGKYNIFLVKSIKAFLFLLSLIYSLAVRVLILFYRFFPYRLNCKVISVGNITLGGTGKTSLVESIARYLKQQGRKVAILSRGYKRKTINYELSTINYQTMGDEPYMLAKNLADIPVIVDDNRIRAAKRAISVFGVDTVILDDGFQQWKIKKDLEIVTVDASNPFGNQHLIPRGILREPLSALRRAGVFILTKKNFKPNTEELENLLRRINQSAPIFESLYNPLGFYKMDNPQELSDAEVLKGNTATLVSGIADPESFENLIKGMGIQVGLSFRFPDHHNYIKEDLDKIINDSRAQNIDTIITTEKDAVRLSSLELSAYRLPLLVLRIELIIKDEERFYNRLLNLYSF